jgi:predicted permease
VQSITLACCFPGTGGPDLPFTIEARAPANGGYNGDAEWRSISPEYFDVFRIPLLRGRTFTDRDDLNSELVAVINEAMAKQFWPNSDPIGAHMTIGHGLGPEFEEPPRRIVGIVGDVIERARGQNNAADPLIYIPVAQVANGLTALDNAIGGVGWAVRTNVPPVSIDAEIQNELRVATGGLPVAQVRTMDDVVAGLTAWNSFNAMLFAVFAGIALFLAAVGIYGLMSYSVHQRRQEIGIRMALGADRWQVRRMVVRQGMTLALIGLFVGVAGGLALTRVMNRLLYGVKSWDPLAFLSTAILLGVVASLACYVPALRASRVDPMVTLRHE